MPSLTKKASEGTLNQTRLIANHFQSLQPQSVSHKKIPLVLARDTDWWKGASHAASLCRVFVAVLSEKWIENSGACC